MKGAYPLYLTYENLTLWDALPEDAGQLAAWWNDGSVMATPAFQRGWGPRRKKSGKNWGKARSATG